MLVPVLILFVCFIAGVMSSGRWLPDLAPGSVGGLAFFAVVGLFSAALSVGGLRAYLLITELNRSGLGGSKAEILADGMQSILFDAGTLFAFAGIVFLLAPGPDEADEQQPTSLSGDI
jgi:predicted phage tail protein